MRDFIKADGVCEKNNICDDCFHDKVERPDKNSCSIHQDSKKVSGHEILYNRPFVIFINFTSACRDCIEQAARAEYEVDPVAVRREWKRISRLAIKTDRVEFLKLVRAATQPRLSQELCWLCAKHAKAQCYNILPSQVAAEAFQEVKINKSLVVTMLPSSDPEKSYKRCCPWS